MFLELPDENADVRALYARELAEEGYVMNLERLWARRPGIREAFVAMRGMLAKETGLTAREQAVIVCAAARRREDSYCSLAWGARLAAKAGPEVAAELLCSGTATGLSARERALAAWTAAAVGDPNATTQADVDALRQAGLSDQDIFDATLLAAFRLAFSTVNDALGAEPDAALAEAAPEEVRRAVDYGRPVAAS